MSQDPAPADAVRQDALDKVTGRARYTSDIAVQGMAYAALVRSQVSHGVIRSVDTTDAERMPGVLAVVTGADLGSLGIVDPYFGLVILDQPVLTADVVRFFGEPVAAVVAETLAEAEHAASLVSAQIETLDGVFDPETALRSDTRIHVDRESADPGLANVAARFEYTGGDVDTAMAAAHYVHRETYRFPTVAHVAMEPHCCTASWDTGNDTLEVISSTQQVFKVRADLARIFGLPLAAVRVRAPYVGGGFGGKLLTKYEPLAAALARAAGRPVRVLLSPEEQFLTIGRHAAVVTIATGVDAEGRMIARDTQVLLDTGAYADKGPGVAKKAAYRAKGPYEIPNFRSVAMAIYTNKVPAGAFRGYSTPQVAWAGESAVNEIAAHLGVDPVQYRLQQLAPRGGTFMPRDTPLDADLAEGLRLAAGALGWGSPVSPGRGRGVATGVKDGGGGPSRAQAEVRMHSDGSVDVLAGTSEIGQGSLTAFGLIAATELGCPPSRVRTRLPDTAISPFDHGTEASRSTVLVGRAVQMAAGQVRDELGRMVYAQFGEPGEFEIADRNVVLADGRSKLIVDLLADDRKLPKPVTQPSDDAPGAREFEMAPIAGHGYYDTYLGNGSPLGTPTQFYEVGHGAAEVEVDRETGEARLIRYVSVADVGTAINATACRAQDDGSAIMGVGHTLHEETIFSNGQPLTASLAEYPVPRISDLPKEGLSSLLLENNDGPGPAGAKGAGEGGIIAVAPSVAAAIHQATGIWVRSLPITPEALWRALNAAPGPDGTPGGDDGEVAADAGRPVPLRERP